MTGPAWAAAAAVLAPAALAALWIAAPIRGVAVRLAPFAALPALGAALIGPLPGEVVMPDVFLGLRFGVDETGRVFALLAAILWTAAGLFGHVYLARDERRAAFFGFFLLTLTGNMGVVFAADALTFYLAFALMTFAAYGLIVHDGHRAAFRAGRIYIIMAVAGEACILSALLMLTAPAAGLTFDAVGGAYAAAGSPALVAVLFLAGFGVKAGVAPLHIWLPLAHPVAPTPASALLSGVMIKAGLLGWLRLLPLGEPGFAWLGDAALVAGLATAFYGVAVGVTQRDAKTILAYSSVSQMGYMAIAVGLGLRAPEHLPAALLAVSIYALHHAVAKGALFLAVGVVPPAGAAVWARWLTWLAAAVPALALAGAPLTTGATAKLALKHGLAALPEAWPWPLDLLLGLATVGTTLLMARFLTSLPAVAAGRAPWWPPGGLWLPWAMLVVPSLMGPLWLPWAYPAPVAVALSPLEELVSGLWPVAVGAALALAVWRTRHRLGPAAAAAVPAGDLVVPLAAGLAAIRRAGAALAIPIDTWVDPLGRRAARFSAAVGRAAAAGDLGFARGLAFGLLALALLAALTFAFVS